eukprot:2952391-Pyramimonas_sp.AAC.1
MENTACAACRDVPTNQTQEAQVYSHDGPIRRRKRRYILTTDQSYHLHAAALVRGPRRRLPRPAVRDHRLRGSSHEGR